MIQLRIKHYTQEERELLQTLFISMSEQCNTSVFSDWYSAKSKRTVLKDILDALVFLDNSVSKD